MSINNIFKFGVVVDVKDEFDGDRVKIYVKGLDPVNFKLDDIPYAFPLLPKNIYVKPKIGEHVFVFTQNDDGSNDRFWVGPIISQPHKLDYDTVTAKSFFKSGLINPDIAPSENPKNNGVQLENNDIGLQGRGSTDLILKPNEVRIRAGKSIDLRDFNRENPSYIQIKYDKKNNIGYTNIVSDYINILSHKSIDKYYLTDPTSLINDEELNKIIEKAHKLPYGDVLVEFMKLFLKAFSSHVHAYAGLPPDSNQIEVKNLLSFDLESMLSNYIKIN